MMDEIMSKMMEGMTPQDIMEMMLIMMPKMMEFFFGREDPRDKVKGIHELFWQ
jgi:hypothetical protein